MKLKELESKDEVKLKAMHYTLTGKIGKREEWDFERKEVRSVLTSLWGFLLTRQKLPQSQQTRRLPQIQR